MKKNTQFEPQLHFIKKINDVIPPNTSLVHELSELLNVSIDSTYRRIRGETLLTIDEVITLCNYYKISFDTSEVSKAGTVTFGYTRMNEGETSFKEFLNSILQMLTRIKNSKQSLIQYACEDIPVFYSYKYPGLAAFKIFYWMKAIMGNPSLEQKKFSISQIPEELIELCTLLAKQYTEIPSVEIWTDTTIQSTLKQIKYFWETGFFNSKADALTVCEDLKLAINDTQHQAKIERKFMGQDDIHPTEKNYSLYFSEIEITNNCVLISMGDAKSVYLGHQSFNTMATTNDLYCKETERWLDQIISKSTLISGVSEKTRNQFFNKIFSQIDNLIDKINK